MGSITVVKETGDLELTGGALCLDFANTLGDRPRSSNEHLGDYGDLIRFRRQAGVLSAADLDEIERMAEEHPRSARAALKRATDLRENPVYRIFSSLARRETPEAEEIQSLNSVLHQALRRLEL